MSSLCKEGIFMKQLIAFDHVLMKFQKEVCVENKEKDIGRKTQLSI